MSEELEATEIESKLSRSDKIEEQSEFGELEQKSARRLETTSWLKERSATAERFKRNSESTERESPESKQEELE